ncbi:MAG: hypothetical protein ACFB00_03855 [Parvularculaceae bacterium]
MKIKSIALVGAAAIALAACETTSTRPYEPSVENVLSIQAARADAEQKLKTGSATAAEGVDVDLSCRALGSLEVAPGKTPLEYISSALQAELFQAGVYDQAAGSAIDIVVSELKFNSFGTGKWEVTMSLSSPNLPDGYSVDVDYEFKTSWSALSACQNVIDAFQPTVSTLIKKAVDDPRFKQL